jgi:hypothetical protein
VEGALGIDWRETRARAVETLAEIDETIDPDKPALDLRKAQQQLVQIARASATSARILIFDEPTAALTNRESERLFTSSTASSKRAAARSSTSPIGWTRFCASPAESACCAMAVWSHLLTRTQPTRTRWSVSWRAVK